ncbi:MAG: class A beta-lactamase-related serine hydrolase [Eubacterium sp.]|nr:class A beta-lactamase-related serine hydrolase [Eubacterium sp.]
MKFLKIRAIAAYAAAFALLLCQSTDVSADKRSQVNVLPDTNTNIFDESMLAELSKITETAESYGGNISVYYNDTETGYYFYYKPNETYKSACTVKASYCQYIIQSGADLDEKIKFTSAVKKSCSGLLSADKVGKYFTVRELIQISIIYSDNMSYRLLFNRFGYKGYNEYIKSLGLNAPQLTATYEFARVTAKDIAKCLKEVYRYSEETGDTFLVDLMKNTDYEYQITSGTKAETAHKFGNQGGTGGYHDSAIVYTEEPYILAIFTNIDPTSKKANEPFQKIAGMVEDFHIKLHKPKQSEKKSAEPAPKKADPVTVHKISYEEYLEMCEDGAFDIIDGCEGECYYYVEGVGRVN